MLLLFIFRDKIFLSSMFYFITQQIILWISIVQSQPISLNISIFSRLISLFQVLGINCQHIYLFTRVIFAVFSFYPRFLQLFYDIDSLIHSLFHLNFAFPFEHLSYTLFLWQLQDSLMSHKQFLPIIRHLP